MYLLVFDFYNFCRVHMTLGATPAMAAGLVETVMKMADVVGLIDAEAAKIPTVRGPYRKKVDEISNSNRGTIEAADRWRYFELKALVDRRVATQLSPAILNADQ